MKFNLSTNLYSRDDLMRAVQNTHNLRTAGFIESRKMPNGVLFVKYWVFSDSAFKWVVCSTFVSYNAILKAKYERTVERSKTVKFERSGVTTTGHITDGRFCDCANYNSDFALFVNNHRVCEHTIAMSKQYLGCEKLSDLINTLDNAKTKKVA